MPIIEEQPTGDLGSPIEHATRQVRIVAWSLALGWVCLFASLLTSAERESSYADLEAGIRAGEISEVQESRSDFGAGTTGYETVDIRWRDGLVRRTATLTHASDERSAAEARRGGTALPVVVGSVADHLTALDPDLRVTRGERLLASMTISGWNASGWHALAHLVLLVATLALISGPRPWRATRWAWAWLVLLAPLVGVPAYFLLGGATGLFRPRPPARVWLTGGWAFLLALLLGGGAASR